MTTSTSTARQPSGIPTGGEFAPAAKPASGVTLGADPQPERPSVQEAQMAVWSAEERQQNVALKELATMLRERYPDAAHFVLEDHSEEPGDVSGRELLNGDGDVIEVDGEDEDEIWESTSSLRDRLMLERDDVEAVGDRRRGYTYRLDLAKAAAIRIPRTTEEKVAEAKARAAGIAAAAASDEAQLTALRDAGDMDAYDRHKDDVDRLELIERQRAELLELIEGL